MTKILTIHQIFDEEYDGNFRSPYGLQPWSYKKEKNPLRIVSYDKYVPSCDFWDILHVYLWGSETNESLSYSIHLQYCRYTRPFRRSFSQFLVFLQNLHSNVNCRSYHCLPNPLRNRRKVQRILHFVLFLKLVQIDILIVYLEPNYVLKYSSLLYYLNVFISLIIIKICKLFSHVAM